MGRARRWAACPARHCVSSPRDVPGTSEPLAVGHSSGGWQDTEPWGCEHMDGDALMGSSELTQGEGEDRRAGRGGEPGL